MSLRRILLFSICSLVALSQAQLQSGPMVGYVTHTTATIWSYAGEGKDVEVRYGPAGTTNLTTISTPPREDNNFTSLAVITGLTPAADYIYEVRVDGSKAGEGTFNTAPIPYQPVEYEYLFASCISYDVSMTQPAWNAILDAPYDFQIFHGDNVYSNSTSHGTIWNHHMTQRGISNFAEVLTRAPTYATWDDHDYGPNDSDGSQNGKENSLRAFQDVWSNPSYGLPDVPGVFFTFHWGDVQYFVLDNRYHRTDPGSGADRTQIGFAQRDWLLQGLKNSRAPFKVILSGGSIQRGSEKWAEYQVEFKLIMNFIRDNKIYGVLWQSGDVHIVYFKKYDDNAQDVFGSTTRNALHAYETEMGYPVYDIISSGVAKHDKRPWAVVDVNTKLSDPTMTFAFYELETFKEAHELKLSDLMHEGVTDLLPNTPALGQKLEAGTTEAIAWRTIGDISTVDLEYSTGAEWKPIAAGVSNTGTFEWTVPDDPSSTVKVRVSDAGGDASGESQGLFEILAGAGTVESPLKGQIQFLLAGHTSLILKAVPGVTRAFIFDLLGKLIGELPIQHGMIIWNGKDRQGGVAEQGLYLLRLGTENTQGSTYRFIK